MIALSSAGYQRSRSPEEFAAHLGAHGVTAVVDVRRRPFSQRPGYDHTGLAAACAAAGLRYVSVRALGNPPEIGAVWHENPAAARARLAEHLRTHSPRSLAHLGALARLESVCLVCRCPDAQACHRRVILELLAADAPGMTHTDLSPA